MDNSKKRVRFTTEDNICVLREVLSINPFEDPIRWVVIRDVMHERTMKIISLRALREHLELLLKKFIEQDNQNKNKTGIEEPYNEYHHLLQQIKDMARDFKSTNNTVSQPYYSNKLYPNDSLEKGKMIRNSYLEQFKKDAAIEVEVYETPEDQVKISQPVVEEIVILTEAIETIPPNNRQALSPKTNVNKAPTKNVSTPYRQRQTKRLRNCAWSFCQQSKKKKMD